jgi:hypothetical protein
VLIDDRAFFVFRVDYDGTCSVARNGGYQDVPCEKNGFVLRSFQAGDPSSLYGLPLIYPGTEPWMSQAFTQNCIIRHLRD